MEGFILSTLHLWRTIVEYNSNFSNEFFQSFCYHLKSPHPHTHVTENAPMGVSAHHNHYSSRYLFVNTSLVSTLYLVLDRLKNAYRLILDIAYKQFIQLSNVDLNMI